MKRIIANIIMFPYGVMMSGPYAIKGCIVSFIIGLIVGYLIF